MSGCPNFKLGCTCGPCHAHYFNTYRNSQDGGRSYLMRNPMWPDYITISEQESRMALLEDLAATERQENLSLAERERVHVDAVRVGRLLKSAEVGS